MPMTYKQPSMLAQKLQNHHNKPLP